ncbi:hypothetical protein KSC_013290 [Ktedonobacter sp. SOSP1-52]|nr:hypothetical protein KSC_013290 [Ktedonobacter sp. SOSP1-52]
MRHTGFRDKDIACLDSIVHSSEAEETLALEGIANLKEGMSMQVIPPPARPDKSPPHNLTLEAAQA